MANAFVFGNLKLLANVFKLKKLNNSATFLDLGSSNICPFVFGLGMFRQLLNHFRPGKFKKTAKHIFNLVLEVQIIGQSFRSWEAQTTAPIF